MKKNSAGADAPKVRQMDREAELDARIRAIREQEQRRMQRRKEVEEDVEEQRRAADSDRARVSVCTRYVRTPSPVEPQPRGNGPGRQRAPGGVGRDFLADPARDGPRADGRSRHRHPERSDGSAAGDDTAQMNADQRRQYQQWLQERTDIDQKRLARARTPDGGWRREWDREKQADPAQASREEQSGRSAGSARGRTQPKSQAVPTSPPHRPAAAAGAEAEAEASRGPRASTNVRQESSRASTDAGQESGDGDRRGI